MEELPLFLTTFFYLIIIMDPIASIPVFLSLTKKQSQEQIKIAATKAVVIAGTLAILFLFIGPQLLNILGLSLSDLKITGGIVLILLGLEGILGINFNKGEQDDMSTVAVLIATPILTGPGLMTAVVIMSNEVGYLITTSAIVCCLLISWLLLYNAFLIKKILGAQIIEISSKIVALFIMALGVSYLRTSFGF
ncbi:MAG: MarC family protein [Candidatus Bilamarchaeaceae archaeon]